MCEAAAAEVRGVTGDDKEPQARWDGWDSNTLTLPDQGLAMSSAELVGVGRRLSEQRLMLSPADIEAGAAAGARGGVQGKRDFDGRDCGFKHDAAVTYGVLVAEERSSTQHAPLSSKQHALSTQDEVSTASQRAHSPNASLDAHEICVRPGEMEVAAHRESEREEEGGRDRDRERQSGSGRTWGSSE